MEIFKDIPNYEGCYQISNLGRVKSLSRTIRCHKTVRTTKERFLKPQMKDTGYLKVGLKKENKTKQFVIHRLIAQAFIPNPENKPTINHINGNKLDNRIENLEWATYSENLKHAYINNLKSAPKGNAHYNSKLTSKDIAPIKELYKYGLKQREIAKIFQVSRRTISNVLTGLNWIHV